jgi:hypothetical protein
MSPLCNLIFDLHQTNFLRGGALVPRISAQPSGWPPTDGPIGLYLGSRALGLAVFGTPLPPFAATTVQPHSITPFGNGGSTTDTRPSP